MNSAQYIDTQIKSFFSPISIDGNKDAMSKYHVNKNSAQNHHFSELSSCDYPREWYYQGFQMENDWVDEMKVVA